MAIIFIITSSKAENVDIPHTKAIHIFIPNISYINGVKINVIPANLLA
ncbi:MULTISPECIES: hypothetical protein [unclassified Clostridium]|nr:hypothetical protein [Clostridium sp.]MCI6691250.1 hypothetical protein [Clostridium sp.]MDY2630046.1 hypothetical protein [Clostridium sp.]MDY4252667.1 hypothetical protein [Clostridium sp.]MDY6227268.1 hypothetical protein [Clostridium sp.]